MRTKSGIPFFGYLKVEVSYYKIDMIFCSGGGIPQGCPRLGGEVKKSFGEDPLLVISGNFDSIFFIIFFREIF